MIRIRIGTGFTRFSVMVSVNVVLERNVYPIRSCNKGRVFRDSVYVQDNFVVEVFLLRSRSVRVVDTGKVVLVRRP